MLVPTHTALEHPDPTEFGLSHTFTLVQQKRSTSRSPPASPGNHPVLLHRCVAGRMGSQLAAPSSLRTVVTPRVLTAYQLAGTGSDKISHTSVGTSVTQSDCLSILRQQHSGCVHSQKGGTYSISLFNKTLELFHLLNQFVIFLIPTHLPEARNVTADALSCLNSPSPTEWRLPEVPLHNLFSVFGTPLVDMFATAGNKMTPV